MSLHSDLISVAHIVLEIGEIPLGPFMDCQHPCLHQAMVKITRYSLITLVGATVLLSGCGSGSGTDPVPDSGNAQAQETTDGDLSATETLAEARTLPAPPASGTCSNALDVLTVDTPTTLYNTDSDCDYYITGGIYVLRSTLTIEPGTTLLMNRNAYIESRWGTIIANGTSDQPIVIRGRLEQEAYWQGIRLYDSPDNQFNYVDIANGGIDPSSVPSMINLREGALHVARSDISITQSSLSGSGTNGIEITYDSTVHEFRDNVLYANKLAGLKIDPTSVPLLDSNSDYLGGASPNGKSYIEIGGISGQAGVSRWKATNAPYRLGGRYGNSQSEILPSAYLVLEPGVSLLFAQNTSIRISGKLLAEGTQERPITWLAEDSTKPWGGVYVSGEAKLRHVTISDATTGLTVENAGQLDIDDVQFTDIDQWAFDCELFANGVDASNFTLGTSLSYESVGLGEMSPGCF